MIAQLRKRYHLLGRRRAAAFVCQFRPEFCQVLLLFEAIVQAAHKRNRVALAAVDMMSLKCAADPCAQRPIRRSQVCGRTEDKVAYIENEPRISDVAFIGALARENCLHVITSYEP